MLIVHVEDEEKFRRQLKKFIESRPNYKVMGFASAEMALEYFENKGFPDLIISDNQLEGRLTGIDMIKRIRELKAKTKIFYLSSDQLTENERVACDGVFYKTDIEYAVKLLGEIMALEGSQEIKRR